MPYKVLNQQCLEEILSEFNLNAEEKAFVQKDAQYYDKYVLVKHGDSVGFIRIWRQHFSDPYMDLELEECDLVNFKGQEIPADKYIDALDGIFELPQVTRCTQKDLEVFKHRGFEKIKNKKGKKYRSPEAASTMLVVVKYLHGEEELDKNADKIRLIKPDDLPIIEDMFQKEYAARFRAIKPLYYNNPNSCFVYDDGSIKGTLLAEISKESLYMHQIFVKKEFRGRGVDKALLSFACHYAKSLEKNAIRGTIRGNLLPYYEDMGIVRDPLEPKSYYVVRLNLKENAG